MKTRPLRAALTITFIGPLLAIVPIILLLLFIYGSRIPATIPAGILLALIQIILIAGYFVGGIPALIAAALTAYFIRSRGWIDKRHWWLFTILIGLGSPVFFYVLSLLFSPTPINRTDFVRLAIFVLPGTIFASIVLRVVIVRLGWMRKEAMAVWEVF